MARSRSLVRARAELEIEPLPVPAITRMRLKNYKSIGVCDVSLHPLTLLVGQNGAGKSNFLDGLRFASDALKTTLGHAIRDRGGISEVRRRSRGHPTHFGLRLDIDLASKWSASYAFQVAARRGQNFTVQREECRVWRLLEPFSHFVVENGKLQESSEPFFLPDEIESDRLYLGLMSSLMPFRQVYQVLSQSGFYNLNLDQIRELQNPDPSDLLLRDGRNLASVVRRMQSEAPETLARIAEYVRAVVPGVRGVAAKSLGPKETVEIRQEVAGDPNPWRYLASGVSDGTLRALGVLVAVFQRPSLRRGIPLVAIEEPEVAIHPGAAVRLMDALLEASRTRQILVTTHSPDLLDHPDISLDAVLGVEAISGNTVVAPVSEALRTAVRKHLYTVGELLRLEQISPDLALFESTAQLRLFPGGDI